MSRTNIPQLSVILPFGDDEERVGSACRAIADYLGSHDIDFELLAIGEESTDNSGMLLGMLRGQIPQLTVLVADRGRAIHTGARISRGRLVAVISPTAASGSLAPLGRAFRRVAREEADVVAVDDRFAVCHRIRSLVALESMRSASVAKLVRAAKLRGLSVDSYPLGGGGRRFARRSTLSKLIEALAPARSPRARGSL